MPALTDSDMDGFADYMQGALEQNKAAITAGDGDGSGWDPTSRVTQLDNGDTAVIQATGAAAQMSQALSAQIALKQHLRVNRYDLASASVSAVEGALGKKHPLVKEMHQRRTAFSRGKKKTNTSAKS